MDARSHSNIKMKSYFVYFFFSRNISVCFAAIMVLRLLPHNKIDVLS